MAIFVTMACALGVFNVVAVPPLQVADEGGHFRRAEQITQGDWFSYSPDGRIPGGRIDTASDVMEHAFAKIPLHPQVKADASSFAQVWHAKWGGPVDFRLSLGAVYPPTYYLPAAATIAIAKASGAGVVRTLYLARFGNLCFAVFLGALALRVARQGRAILTAILLMPMATFQMASVSQDSGLIASSVLLVALVTRASEARQRKLTFITVAILCTTLAMSRLPLIAFSLLLLAPAWARGEKPIAARFRFATFGAVVSACLAWAYYVATRFWNPAINPPNVSWREQLAYVVSHPNAFPNAVLETFRVSHMDFLRGFVGILGYLDVLLPGGAYTAAYIGLAVACATRLFEPSTFKVQDCMLFVSTLIVGAFMVVGIFYFTWTPVGAGVIGGVQGRYFLCIAPLFALAIPTVRQVLSVFRLASLAAVIAIVLCVVQVPLTILERYYVGSTDVETALNDP